MFGQEIDAKIFLDLSSMLIITSKKELTAIEETCLFLVL